MDFGYLVCITLVAICYAVGYCLKKANWLDDNYIPAMVTALGIILGIVAFIIKMPDFPAHDIITAIAVGAISGLASTGINQLHKQLTKGR